MKKKCSKCGEMKELTEFYKSKRNKNGHQYKCTVCCSAYEKIYQLTESGKEARARSDAKHALTEKGKATHSKSDAKYRSKYPLKHKAVKAVNNAIRDGKLTRPTRCSQCGIECKPDGHHRSYLKEHRLDIIWLCRQCHTTLHLTLTENALG